MLVKADEANVHLGMFVGAEAMQRLAEQAGEALAPTLMNLAAHDASDIGELEGISSALTKAAEGQGHL